MALLPQADSSYGNKNTYFGEKKATVLSVMMSVCVGSVLHGVIPTHLNHSSEAGDSSKPATEKSSKCISINGHVETYGTEMKE